MMGLFVGSLVIAFAFVVGAWIRLAPSADERRLGKLRAAASLRGLKLRWVSGAERERLGLPSGLTWYGLALLQPLPGNGSTCVAVPQEGTWRWVDGAGPEAALQDVPAGVHALQVGDGLLQAAWDERDETLLEPLALWLDARRAGLGSDKQAPH
ncbi:MAG: hypothetical protein ACLGHG_04125 [Gammaproteobacteria bacterium]